MVIAQLTQQPPAALKGQKVSAWYWLEPWQFFFSKHLSVWCCLQYMYACMFVFQQGNWSRTGIYLSYFIFHCSCHAFFPLVCNALQGYVCTVLLLLSFHCAISSRGTSDLVGTPLQITPLAPRRHNMRKTRKNTISFIMRSAIFP